MTFTSILFVEDENLKAEQPDCFHDLNLDQVIEALTANRKEYDLEAFFYLPLRSVDAIYYRHEVMRDLQNHSLLETVRAFAKRMVIVRRYLNLTEKLHFKNHRDGWFLESVLAYGEAVERLAGDLEGETLRARAFIGLREYVSAYAHSPTFQEMMETARQIKAEMENVQYCIVIKEGVVRVRRYEGEPDYSLIVEKTFEKFKQGAVKDYRVDLYEGATMNHVEAQILDLVARLYPEVFARLYAFCLRYEHFLNETVLRFDREVQFYLAWLEYILPLQQAGLEFCYPIIAADDKEIYSEQSFDLALASQLTAQESPVVCNDFFLKGPERIFVISGPNQGGKTTFARMFGQLHFLASLGLPVPGRQARLFLPDRVFTHFEKIENIKNLRGKLHDDLVRVHAILESATPNSLLIFNEIFASTTLRDAVFLSRRVMERVHALDLLCVWVTFIDELSAHSEKTVSLVSTVRPDNPAERTFKIVRRPADGLAYALSLAEKHRLTYDQIKERIRS